MSPKAINKRSQAKAKRKAASKAKDKAKAAGGAGPNGSDAQRALRDFAIISALGAGDKPQEVATEFGVSKRTVNAVAAKDRALPSPLSVAPIDILDELTRDYRRRIHAFDRMAHAHAERNPNVAVSAMKAALDATERQAELLTKVGQLPENLQTFRAEAVLQRIAERMVDVMGELRAGKVTVEQADEFFGELIASSENEERQRALPAAS